MTKTTEQDTTGQPIPAKLTFADIAAREEAEQHNRHTLALYAARRRAQDNVDRMQEQIDRRTAERDRLTDLIAKIDTIAADPKLVLDTDAVEEATGGAYTSINRD